MKPWYVKAAEFWLGGLLAAILVAALSLAAFIVSFGAGQFFNYWFEWPWWVGISGGLTFCSLTLVAGVVFIANSKPDGGW